jgi:hypothetical protein
MNSQFVGESLVKAASGLLQSLILPQSNIFETVVALSAGLNGTGAFTVSGTPSESWVYGGPELAVGSDEFTASGQADATADGKMVENDGSIVTTVSAIGGAIICLALLIVGAVLVMKRRNRKQHTDCAMEYETEGRTFEVRDDDSEKGQTEEWDVRNFENALELSLDGSTHDPYVTNDHLFVSDCGELF